MQTDTKHLHFSLRELMELGVDEVAYVRPVVENGQHLFAVCAANGERLGLVPTRDMAMSALAQNDLDLVPLH